MSRPLHADMATCEMVRGRVEQRDIALKITTLVEWLIKNRGTTSDSYDFWHACTFGANDEIYPKRQSRSPFHYEYFDEEDLYICQWKFALQTFVARGC